MRRLVLMSVVTASFFAGACCTRLPRLGAKSIALPEPPPEYAEVVTTRESWRDEKRQRDVPVTIYAPAGAQGRLPVVVFSHGIGEDRDSYAWLGEALARRGFLTVHVTHAGTDRAVLKRGYRFLYRAVKEKVNWVNRPLDVSFVLDRLGARPDADLARVAVAGHSAGAFTAFAVAGLRVTGGETLRDPRVKVAVAMSMPRLDGVVPPGGYDAIAIPLLNMTGTCDTSLIYRTFPRHRRIPFEQTHAARQYLVTLQGGTHNSFVIADSRQRAIISVTAAFLRAWLRGDEAALRWFDEAGLDRTTNSALSVERKDGAAR